MLLADFDLVVVAVVVAGNEDDNQDMESKGTGISDSSET